MKRCPTCQKTFADTMRFCQIDGTPLLEDEAPPVDPFKTVVSGNEDISSAMPPVDPFKTMIGSAPPFKQDQDDDDDLLQLDEPDPMKTMINPGTFGKEEINFDQIREDIKKDVPPPAPAEPKTESKSFGETPTPIPPPKSNEPNLNPPSFGSSSPQTPNPPANSFESNPPKFDSTPVTDKPFVKSTPENPPPAAIPSPFDLSMPPGYHVPSTPPFNEPEQLNEPEQPKAPEPTFREAPPAPRQNAFDQFQSPPSAGQQMQQTEWTPPPAPEANWQNQSVGANTPFQPPAVGQGDNKTLAIVSLVLGLISIPCCSFIVLGIGAFVTGFLAKKKADENPSEYGGRGLALAGMIIGGITTVIGLIVIVLQVVFGTLTNLQ